MGDAVNPMVLTGLGLITEARSLVPRCFQHTPTARLRAPRVPPAELHEEALERALETRSAEGGPERYRRLAATWAPLDRTSVHGERRYHREEEPEAAVMPSPAATAHRPDLNHVLLALRVEPQAGMPVLRPPLGGHPRDGHPCGHVVTASVTP